MIGDRATDIKAGDAASIVTILYDSNNSQKPYLNIHNVTPKYTVTSLLEISEIIQANQI